jgi:hypothetical protein
MIKSRRMRYAEHELMRTKEECIQGFGVKARRKETTREMYGALTLQRILEKEDRVVWTGLIWLRIGTSDGFL